MLLLADLTAGELAAATVHLFANDVNPGKGAVTADFIEATFTGSTALPITAWGSPFLNEDLDASALGPLMQWNWTAGVTDIVYGVYVLSAGAGTPLLAYARLETPKEMGTVDDSLALVPRWTMSAAGFGSFATLAP